MILFGKLIMSQDTAGEEKYRALSKYYCRGAGAVILAFDLSNKQTFDQLE